MSAKGTKVTEREKKRMWELYQDLQSFKKVAKKMRRNPDTVSRYVHEYESTIAMATQLVEAYANSKSK